MGNTASSSHGKVQNRLSKPKTNTNSPVDSPAINRHSDLKLHTLQYEDTFHESAIWSTTGDCRSKEAARQALRNELCGTRGSDGSSSDTPEEDGLGDLATHVRERLVALSRSGSNASQVAGKRASAARLSASQVDLRAPDVKIEDAVRILRELSRVASPDDILALQRALEPVRSTKATPDSITNRSMSTANDSTQSLIRRRSLAIPGIATRNVRQSASDTLLKPPRPSADSQRDSKVWQLNEFGVSPLARIASIGAESEDKTIAPRSETPADLEQLGSFQLGSLVITNGAASPVPSLAMRHVAHRQSTPDLHRDDDYFTADEERASIDVVREARPHIVKAHKSLASLKKDLHAPLKTSQPRSPGALVRCDSPLKVGHLADSSPTDNQPASDPVLTLPTTPQKHLRNASAQHFANDYLSNLAPSPFASSRPASALQISQQATEELEMHRDGKQSSPSTLNSRDFREEALSILEGTSFAEPSHQSDQSEMAWGQSAEKQLARPVQTKVDSGYSSSTSVFNFNDFSPPAPSRAPPHPPVARDASSDQPQATFDRPDDEAKRPHASMPPATSILEQKQVPGVEQEIKKARSGRRFSSGSYLQASPSNTITPKRPSPVAIKSSPNLKKLQKRRQLPDLPIVTSPPIVNGTIPHVPDHLAKHLEYRLSASPGMDCLQRTFTSVAHVDAEHESVGSLIMSEPLEFPFWDSPAPKSKIRRRISSSQPPPPPVHKQSPRTLDPHDYLELDHLSREDEIFSPTITDFGTVAESLGSSPYDAARTVGSTHSRSGSQTRTHPHQLGRSMSRPRSVHNMTDEDASRLARERSVDRAIANGMDAKPSRPRGRSRPRSHYDRPEGQIEKMALRGMRPRSMYDEAPPVPDMPRGRNSFVEQVEKPLTTILREQREALKPVRKDSHQSSEPSLRGSDNAWGETQRTWALRRQAAGEGVRASDRPSFPRAHTDRSTSRSPDKSRPTSTTGNGLYDRYGGGLAYGYEKGFGLGGSAGTRAAENKASRKGLNLSYTHGVDLSDVPVFLRSDC